MDKELYSSAHRKFVRACANFGSMPIDHAKKVLQKVLYRGDVNQIVTIEKLKEIIEQCNEKLNELEQKITIVQMDNQDQLHEFVVFCGAKYKSNVQSAIPSNPAESNYVKVLIENIIMAESKTILFEDALNTAKLLPSNAKITLKRANELIKRWISIGYFLKLNNSLHLGPRTIGEFDDIILSKFPEYIRCCSKCHQITFKPVKCPDPQCDAALDKRCATKFVALKKKCPKCKKPWQSDE